MSSLRKHQLLLLSVLAMAIGAGGNEALSAGLVSEVAVSTDCRRLVVTTVGKPEIAQIFSMNRPPRLVVDFKDTRFTGTFKKMRYEDQPIREVRAASRGKGMRLVVEFADRAVPEHRVREIDGHLIILLAELPPMTPQAMHKRNISADRDIYGSTKGKSVQGPKATVEQSGLRIKSACVSNGMIVLDVATDRNPDQHFRIDLGVDLKEMGFSTAEIRRRKQVMKNRSVSENPKTVAPRRSGEAQKVARGSARLGLGSVKLSKGSEQKGFFDVKKLKRRGFRSARNHVKPVVKVCGYSPPQDKPIR